VVYQGTMRQMPTRRTTIVALALAGLLLWALAPTHSAFAAEASGEATSTAYVVVTLGDSVTTGHGAPYPATQSWPAVLASTSGITVMNRGVGGNTTAMMRSRFETDVVSYAPDAVIILGGVHDAFQKVPRAETQANLEWMVTRAQECGITPYVATLPPTTVLVEALAFMNDSIRAFAQRRPGVGLIDFRSAFVSAGSPGGAPYLVDLVHFDAAGYRLMADAARPAVENRHAPVALPDHAVCQLNRPLEVASPGVVANDEDADSDPLVVRIEDDVDSGRLVMNSDGSYVYTPALGFRGADTFTYSLFDGVRYSQPASVTVSVESTDVVAPRTEASGASDDWTPGPVEVRLVAEDDPGGSGVRFTSYALDGMGVPIQYFAPFALNKEGETTVEYWSTDWNGNEEPSRGTAVFRIDNTPPVTTADVKPVYDEPARITLVGDDGSLSGVVKTEWRLDGGGWNHGAMPSVQSVGKHTLEYRSVDAAGNAESVRSAQFTIRGVSQVRIVSQSRNPLPSGAAFPVEGYLTCESAPVAGERVVLQQSTSNGLFKDTQYSMKTSADGKFAFSVRPTWLTRYRVRHSGSLGWRPAAPSNAVYARPRPRVGPPIARATMSRFRKYKVYGFLNPRHAAGGRAVRIYMWRRVAPGKWRSYGFVSAVSSDFSGGTKYTQRLRLPRRGTWRLRAYAPADGGHAAAWSAKSDYVVVR